MKTNILLTLAVLLLVSPAKAQEQQKATDDAAKHEAFVEMRVRKMADELMLSDADAAKFAPLYKSYLEEMRALFGKKEQHLPSKDSKSKEQKEKSLGAKKKLTDNELDQLQATRIQSMRKRIDLQENYYKKFRKILSAKQVQKVMHTQSFHFHGGKFGPQRPSAKKRHDGKETGPAQQSHSQKKLQEMKRSVRASLK